MGSKAKSDGVGIFVAEKWVDSVVSVEKHSERILRTRPRHRRRIRESYIRRLLCCVPRFDRRTHFLTRTGAGPNKRGHRLMTITLSNLNRLLKIYWKIPR